MLHIARLAVVILILLMAACEETAGQSAFDTGTMPAVVVANTVAVDVSGFAGIEGRDIARSPHQIGADLARAIQSGLSGPGPANVDVSLSLTSLRLTSPAAAFAFGGPSTIEAVVTVSDARTGQVLLGPQTVRGRSETLRVPGLIGVATSPSPDRDYDQTLRGFAAAVRTRLSPGTPDA